MAILANTVYLQILFRMACPANSKTADTLDDVYLDAAEWCARIKPLFHIP